MKSRGFTLIELLVVIAIIGILASVVLASLSSARAKARDAQRLSDIQQIQKALALYYDDNGNYPITGWRVSYTAGSGAGGWGWLQTQLAPYLSTLATDPTNTSPPPYQGGYSYAYYSNLYGGAGQWYMLAFKLENQKTSLERTVTACDGTTFNYGGNDGYILTWGGDCQ